MKFRTILFYSLTLAFISISISYLLTEEKLFTRLTNKQPQAHAESDSFDLPASLSIKKEIETASHCESDTDCRVLDSKCPFGCFVAINRSETERIDQLIDGFNSTCDYKCMKSFGATCQENSCKIHFTPIQ